jgi:hypothetical protein
VRLVSTQCKDEADSDEKAADGFQPFSIMVAQALELAQAVSE